MIVEYDDYFREFVVWEKDGNLYNFKYQGSQKDCENYIKKAGKKHEKKRRKRTTKIKNNKKTRINNN